MNRRSLGWPWLTEISDNTVGLYVGEGASLTEVTTTSAPGPLQVQVDSATSFTGNGTRLSASGLPLPPTVGSTPEHIAY